MKNYAGWSYIHQDKQDKTLGYAHTPNISFDFKTEEWESHISFNEQGFRGPLLSKKKDSIFLIGDSFVEAVQLKEGLTARSKLQNLLSDKSYSYVVNNLGVGSYSTVQYYNTLLKYGAEFQPKIVVMLIWGNDIPRDAQFERNDSLVRDEEGLIIELGNDPSIATVSQTPRYKNFYIFWVLDHLKNKISKFAQNDFTKPPPSPFYWGILHPENKAGFKATLKYIKASKLLSEKLGLHLILGAIPFGDQVGKNQIGVGFHSVGSSISTFNPNTQYPDVIKDFASEHSIHYVDILKKFRSLANNDGEKLYFTWDGHLNELGNQRLAELIFEYIYSKNLLNKK